VNSQVPWIMHQPVQPCAKSSGCPEFCISKGCARDGASSCLDSRILRHVWRANRGFALPVAPPNEVASCPASCIFRLCRRRILELPRVSRPSAHPVVKLRSPRSSILRLRLSMLPPGRPGFCIFRPCRRWTFELPRISHPSAPLSRQLRVSPQSRISSCACRCISRVAPVHASSGFAGDGFSSCLASRVLRRRWRWCFGLPLGSALPIAPLGMVAGCPALPHLPALPRV